MPLLQSSQDHLQFIDPTPSPSSLSSARALITASLDPETTQTPHPSLPTLHTPNFSPSITTEHTHLSSNPAAAARTPAIDLSRYEEPSAPTNATDTQAWRTTLQSTYTSSEYLSSRISNLGLLETYGKNAWLIGNSQLEDLLRDLEKEVAEVTREKEDLERARRERQGAVEGELRGLEESWRKGVGRVIEVQAASEGLRREILERRREGAR